MSTRHLPGRWVPAPPAASIAIVVALALGACSPDQATTEVVPPSEEAPVEPEPEPTPEGTPQPAMTLSEAAPDPMPLEAPEGWELVWNDEFEGDEIDRSTWTFDIGGWGWGNGEAQYYTDRPENARLHDGLLVIEARQEKFEDSYYTSARLKTQGLREFLYGRIEARMKVPAGKGLWPAFWMLGANHEHGDDVPEERRWPNVGEIDVMEYIGREPDLIMGTAHGPGYAGALGITRWNRQEFAIADDFHTYAVEWEPDKVTWFFDGEPYHTLEPEVLAHRDWVFDHEFFLIVNLAVGGQLPGPVGLDVEFPRQLLVDHVRVWQRTEGESG